MFNALYFDDNLIVGNEKVIKKTVASLSKIFKITVEGELKDYLGCEIKLNRKGKCAWLGWPHLYKKIREYIEDGKVKIVFVKSEENIADIFTKNVNGEIYNKHVPTLVWSEHEMNDVDENVSHNRKGVKPNLESVEG